MRARADDIRYDGVSEDKNKIVRKSVENKENCVSFRFIMNGMSGHVKGLDSMANAKQREC